jgi:hypothetical protein
MLPSPANLALGIPRAFPIPRSMDRSLFRYILRHTWRDQVFLLLLTAISFPLIYVNLEIPKRIVNGAIQGKKIPETFFGFHVTQISYLMALSMAVSSTGSTSTPAWWASGRCGGCGTTSTGRSCAFRCRSSRRCRPARSFR